MKSLLCIIFSFLPTLASATPQDRTLSEYMKGPVKPGDVVCEPVQNFCYLTLSEESTLTPENDSSGALEKGAVTPSQRQFTKVIVKQILFELERGQARRRAPVDVYVKVNWEAKDNGLLAMRLAHENIVHGRLVLDDQGRFVFRILDLPDMIFPGHFSSTLDVAEVFGHNVVDESATINDDLKRWLSRVLNAVLPQLVEPVTLEPLR